MIPCKSGLAPHTGTRVCTVCGKDLDPKEDYIQTPPVKLGYSSQSNSKSEDTSLDDTNKALERAFKDYRIGCDMALSERDDGVYTQAEYEEAIMWELDNAISFVHEIYSSLLKQQQIKLIERIEGEVIGEEPMLGDKDARLEVYKLQPGQTELHVPRVDFVTREALREEQREAINKLKDNVINGGSL